MEVVPRPKADPRWRMEGRLSCAEKLSTGRHVAHRMSAAWGGGVTCWWWGPMGDVYQQLWWEVLARKYTARSGKLTYFPEIPDGHSWLCLPAHCTLSIWQVLDEKSVAMVEQPPYSRDLALCDFCFLFPPPKFMRANKGTSFETATKMAVMTAQQKILEESFSGVHGDMAEKDRKRCS